MEEYKRREDKKEDVLWEME